jgi:serine/threonine-protein kinase
MDFGIAHMAASGTLTQEGAAVGTVYYMSPEQAAGKKTDARSDIFSIAAVLYEMVTGEYPFPGEHPMAVMYSITNLPPKTLAEHPVQVPTGLQPVVDKAMEKSRDSRYPDAAAFRDALRELRERELGLAPAPSLRSRVLQIGGPVAVVIVLAVVAFMLFGRGGAPKPDRDAAKNLNELGQSAQENGDLASARDEYRRAIVADPGYKIPWNNLGVLALNEGNLVEADSLFRKAISIDTSYAAALHNLASVRQDRGDLTSAERFYRASLRADSTLLASYNNLGALLLQSGRPAEAGDVLDKGLLFYPDQPYLLKNRGVAAEKLGNDVAAIDFWNRGIEKDSTIVELQRLSAEWYERHGRITEARAHWETVAGSPIEEERRVGTAALERLRSR